MDSASIFIKVTGHKLSDGSSNEKFLFCRINFANRPVQNQAPHFVNMGITAINTLNEKSVLSTPNNRIWRSTDGYHWSVPDHVFGETTAVRMNAEKSDYDYIFKNDFEIWKENQVFERQNISMSWPPLDSTPIGSIRTNVKTSHLESTPIGTKTPVPKPLIGLTYSSKGKWKAHVPEDLESYPSSSESSLS